MHFLGLPKDGLAAARICEAIPYLHGRPTELRRWRIRRLAIPEGRPVSDDESDAWAHETYELEDSPEPPLSDESAKSVGVNFFG
jgi:hypothetical protein